MPYRGVASSESLQQAAILQCLEHVGSAGLDDKPHGESAYASEVDM